MKLYFALLLTLASGLLARAASYSFTIFNPTGLTDSTAAGINDGGQIVGLGSNSSGLQGFVYDHGASVVFSAPGATDNITRAVGINNAGVVAGAAIGFDGFSSYPSFGFIYNHGAFTTEALYGPHGGGLFGINDSGELVGRDNLGNPFFRDASGVSHAVNLPKGTARSYFSAINNVGEIGGSYADSSGANHAVLYQNGVVTVLPDRYDQAMAINNVGQILAHTVNDQYGLLNSNLAFSQLIFPNDFYQVIAYGLNDSGQIVGTTEIGKSEYAFVAAPTTVPEPTSWSLGLCGLIAALLLVREGRSFSQLRKSDEPGATIAAVRN